MRAHAEMIANLDKTVPLIADMDTGFGAPIMVSRSVEEFVRAGVAGFHIEDQILSKRCGHLQVCSLALQGPSPIWSFPSGDEFDS